MSTLGFEKLYPDSTPIASVKGGPQNKKVLYMNPIQFGKAKDDAEQERKYIDFYAHKKLLKGYKPKEKDEICGIFTYFYKKKGKARLEDPKLLEIYNEIINKESKQETFDKIKLPPNSYFQPYPIGKCFSVTYCYGQSGSGKSYYANMYAKNYKKMYPNNDVYLLTHPEADTDPAFDGTGVIRIDVSMFLEDTPKLDDFKNSLLIFDDYENIKPKELNDIIHKLIDDVASLGRKKCISAFAISHLASNYKKTKLLLGETNQIVVYMHTSAKTQVNYLLENYGNCDKEQLQYLRTLPSRWVCVNKFPFCYVSETECGVLH